jgi:predicted enzyme related to lactoylglutathione lyase
MAVKKAMKKSAAKKSAAKTGSKKSLAMKKATAKKGSTKKGSTKKGSTKKAAAARKIRPGFISHTELASSDPAATAAWAKKALGWKFGEAMPTPAGPYHMWSFGDNMGGGIRANNPPETPGSVPYVEVPAIKPAYQKALDAGATLMMPPSEIPGGNGWIAIVAAPGGPAIGFWAQK